MNPYDNNHFMALLNSIVLSSYYNGGDRGGPYDSCEKEVVEAMNRFLGWTGLSEAGYTVAKVPECGCLQFVKLAHGGDN